MLRAYLFFSLLLAVSCQDKPNIIVILADDLGFEDIGYTNPDVLTPNIDDLARNGVILERNYVQQVCTPSRAALMTGIYPYKLGLQVSVSGIMYPVLCLHFILRECPLHQMMSEGFQKISLCYLSI